jgi:hypothetical protein
LKKFGRAYNQNKETTTYICSPPHKYGSYNWALGVEVRKHSIKNEFFLVCYLHCNESADQSKFPVDAYIRYCVVNQENDLRKTFSKGKTYS